MRTFELNLQTTLFMDDTRSEMCCNVLLAIYNRASNMLVYNKPGITGEQFNEILTKVKPYALDIHRSEEIGKGQPYDEILLYPTDSFGMNFYDHHTGGYSQFHEVKKRAKKAKFSHYKLKTK